MKIYPAPCFPIVRSVLGRVTIHVRPPELGGTRGRALTTEPAPPGKRDPFVYVATFFRPGDWT